MLLPLLGGVTEEHLDLGMDDYSVKKRKEKQDWCLLTALGFSAGLNRLLLTFTSWASRGCLF